MAKELVWDFLRACAFMRRRMHCLKPDERESERDVFCIVIRKSTE